MRRLPPALRRWRPKEKPVLPPPDGDFFQVEAAKAFGCDLARWYALPVELRARMVAHEVERNLREGYTMEAGRRSRDGKQNARDAMWSAWGVG